MGVDSPKRAMATILLTGFPGFLGERLLPRLVALLPEARFACLVQPKFEAVARQALERLAAREPRFLERVSLLAGDITKPLLGMTKEDARSLGADVTRCFHLAAVYDLAVSRETGLLVNREGTRHVLEFVQQARAFERLDYVSTAYVSGTAKGVFKETDLDVGQSFKNFYEETKFLAEALVVKSGVPFVVYRPGIVVGDSKTGETAKFDGPYFALAAMERLPSPGVFVRIGSGRETVNLVPSDFVIEALTRLSAEKNVVGSTFHLTDPEPLKALEIGRLLARELGKRFWYLPVPLSLAKALFSPKAVQRFFGMPVEVLDYFDHPCRYDSTLATAHLEAQKVRCPPFAEYASRLVAFYLRERGRVRRTAMV